MNNFEKRLDEIIERTRRGMARDSGGESPHLKAGYTREQATEAIRTLILEEVIGEDIRWNREQRMQFSTSELDSFAYLYAVNSTLEDMRKKVKGE